MYGRGGHNQRQAPAAKLAGITDDDRAPRRFRHRSIYARFQNVGRGQAVVNVKPVYPQEQQVRAQLPEGIFGQRAYQRVRVLAQDASRKDYFDRRVRKLRGDVCGVGNDREIFDIPAGSRDRHGGGAGIQNDHLPLTNLARRGRGNPNFLLAMLAFFLLQRAILERAGHFGQRAAMGSLQLALVVERFQIFANRNLRGAEVFGKIPHQDAAICAQEFEDFATSFFTQHVTVFLTFLSKLRQSFHMNLVL